jgi:hypothetical protein
MRVQRWGRRGWVWFALVAVTAMIAVPTGLSAAGVKDKWWTGLIAGAAIVLAAFAKPLADRLQRITTRREDNDLAVLNGCLVTARGDLPAVRRIQDPRQLGVHPAGSDSLPTYVPRDVDEKLRRIVRHSRQRWSGRCR